MLSDCNLNDFSGFYLRQSGMALVSVLLYMLVVTSLVLSGFWMSFLQFKMGSHFQAAEVAFQYAESALLVVESQIHEKTWKGEGAIGQGVTYRFERTSTDVCGMWFYEVHVRAVYAAAVRKLESVFLLPVYNKDCPEVLEVRRRVLWREVM